MQPIVETLLTTFLTFAASGAWAQDRPNIVIFHCHDLGQYLHCYGVKTVCTPNFDKSQQWRPRSDPVVPESPAAAFHPHLELYDLTQDPWEQANLVDKPECAAVRSELASRLYQHMVATNDPLLHGAITPPQHETTLKLLQETKK